MRRKDREIGKDEAISILKNGFFGVLSTVGESNLPYGVPLNYYFENNAIYFHSAMEGKKIQNFLKNPYVSFCVVGKYFPIPERFSTSYESVIISGKISEVFGDEKISALLGLIKKYAPQQLHKGEKYIEKYIDETRVFKIEIDKITGKRA